MTIKNWIRNVKANKAAVKDEIYKFAGERFIKTSITIGVCWAADVILSGWLEPKEIKEVLENGDD
jgi:hypothetical protein